jgi:transposase-like protein
MKSGRKRAAEWAAIIQQWQSSGLSVRGYCREHGLREARFYWWRKQLARATKVKLKSPAVSDAGATAKPIDFLPVRIKQAETGEDTGRSTAAQAQRIDIFLPSGAVVRLNGSMPGEKLSLIMQMVAGAPC